MIAVTVEFSIHQAHVDAFHRAMQVQAKTSLDREPSCRQFDICFAPDDSSKVFLYEVYDDRAAFDAHLASEHFGQFDSETKEWVASKSVQIWDVAR